MKSPRFFSPTFPFCSAELYFFRCSGERSNPISSSFACQDVKEREQAKTQKDGMASVSLIFSQGQVAQKASQHTAARGVIGGNRAESTFLDDFPQPLGIMVLNGKKKNKGAPCGTPSKRRQRRTRESNPQPVTRQLISSQPAHHSHILQITVSENQSIAIRNCPEFYVFPLFWEGGQSSWQPGTERSAVFSAIRSGRFTSLCSWLPFIAYFLACQKTNLIYPEENKV